MALNDISCRAWPSNINLKWNRLEERGGKEESMISSSGKSIKSRKRSEIFGKRFLLAKFTAVEDCKFNENLERGGHWSVVVGAGRVIAGSRSLRRLEPESGWVRRE